MSFSNDQQVDTVEISSGKIGLVEAKKGENLPSGEQFGKAVECMNFQDETEFIKNGGQRGRQLSFLTAGIYHINTEYFSVEIVDEIRINEDEIGLVKAIYGKPLPLGQHFGKVVECNNFQDAQAFINNDGQRGKQLAILTSNTYSINTWIFEVKIDSVTKIPLGEIGLIIANDGVIMPNHRKLGKSVKCKDFQDAQAFIDNGGESGKQLGILRDGKKYQINTELFTVITSANAEQYGLKSEQLKYYKVEKDSIGIVTTTEGRTSLSYSPRIEGHYNFQDPQKFIDGGGYQGLQEEVLPEGHWALNPWFIRVKQVPIIEIPQHCIGILLDVFPKSIGRESENNMYRIIPPGKSAINTSINRVSNSVPINEIHLEWNEVQTKQNDNNKNPFRYPSFRFSTQDRLRHFQLHLIVKIKIGRDNAYQFILEVADRIGEVNVVSDKDLVKEYAIKNFTPQLFVIVKQK